MYLYNVNPILQTPIDYLKGVGPNRAELLRSELGIHTFQELLHLFPNRYIDRSRYFHINELQRTNAEVQIVGKVTHLETVRQKRGKRLVAYFEDESGSIELVWFKGHQWIQKGIKLNQPYVIFGRLNWYGNKCSMAHPEMELLSEHDQNLQSAMQPVYPSTEKLTSRGVSNRIIRQIMQNLFLEVNGQFEETLSESIRERLKLISKNDSLLNIHFPKNQNLLAKAQYRLKFEEFFFIQMQLALKNSQRKQKIKGFQFPIVGDCFHDFYNNHLPFDLTNAQKKVLKEIRSDFATNAQMNRLLQGDVGSGKTIVALLAMLIAIDNGFQACLVAPTEILAQQHFAGIQALVKPMNISVRLLTGSVKKKTANRNPLWFTRRNTFYSYWNTCCF